MIQLVAIKLLTFLFGKKSVAVVAFTNKFDDVALKEILLPLL